MKKTPGAWKCECGALNVETQAFCEVCGDPRITSGREPTSPGTVSYWTCDFCHSRTPGQPVIYQPDGPRGALRGLCSSCHFDERIATKVRATPEEVRQNLLRIRALEAKLVERIEL